MRYGTLCLFVVSWLTASAQSDYSRFEIGTQASFTHFTLPHISEVLGSFAPHSENIYGIGSRFTWNLSTAFAIDSELDWYPRHLTTFYLQDGGRVLKTFVGPKLTGYRDPHLGFFGTVRPGLMSFGRECIAVAIPPNTFACSYGRVTHFALDLGGVLELYPTRKWILRFDLGNTLVQMYDRTAKIQFSPHLVAFLETPGAIRPSWQVTAGVSYRIGMIRPVEQSQQVGSKPKFELGAQFGSLGREYSTAFVSSGGGVITGKGGGARFTYNLSHHFSLDSALMFFPNNQRSLVNFQDGGNALQGLFGVKAGLRQHRVGYFIKLRPGFLHFSKTVTDLATFSPRVTPITHAALDIGSVIEIYPSKRTTVRFDAGDTLAWIGARRVTGLTDQPPSVVAPGDFRHMIQLGVGVGLRF